MSEKDVMNLVYTCFVTLVLLVIVACCSGGSEAKEQPQKFDYKTGWELVGEQDNCKLYRKCVKYAGSCSMVFWSVCDNDNGSGTNSSISAH